MLIFHIKTAFMSESLLVNVVAYINKNHDV